MGWWRSPAVEKGTGGLAGGVALPGMKVIGLVCSERGEGSKWGAGRGSKGGLRARVR